MVSDPYMSPQTDPSQGPRILLRLQSLPRPWTRESIEQKPGFRFSLGGNSVGGLGPVDPADFGEGAVQAFILSSVSLAAKLVQTEVSSVGTIDMPLMAVTTSA